MIRDNDGAGRYIRGYLDALTELCRRQLQSGQLPATGGIRPRLVITIPAQSLNDRTGAGRLNDRTQISPTLTASLGCDDEINPAFLDSAGNLIDLGRMHHPPPRQ